MKTILKTIFVLVLYLYIYGPPFQALPVNISTILSIPSLLYLLTTKCKISIGKKEYLILLGITAYCAFTSARSEAPSLFINFFTITILNTPTAIALVNIANTNKINLLDYFVGISVLAGILAILISLDQSLAEFIKFKVLKYDQELMKYQSHRAFGFSDELLFSFSIVQAIAFHICLTKIKAPIKIKSIACSILFISIILNAKLGILLVCTSVISQLRLRNLKIASIVKFIFIATLITTMAMQLDTVSNTISIQTLLFLSEIAPDNFSSSINENSSVSIFLNTMLNPSNQGLEILWGTGIDSFSSKTNQSDSGWIILYEFGGIILLASVLFLCSVTAWHTLKTSDQFNALFLALLIIAANTKGLFIAPKPGMRALILITIYFYATHTKSKTRNPHN